MKLLIVAGELGRNLLYPSPNEEAPPGGWWTLVLGLLLKNWLSCASVEEIY